MTILNPLSADAILADLHATERLAALDPDRYNPDSEPWETPIPVGAARILPLFPVDALPTWLADYVAAVAEETQTPVDLPGCLALAVLATAAGGRAVVAVRGRWREPVNLYVAVALPPANRKSAVFSLMTTPLLKAERALAEGATAAIVEAETTARLARAAAEKATAKAATAEGAERDTLTAEAVGLAQAAEEARVPARPQLVADDATPEAIASLLAEQGGRLAVLSAEGGIFDIIAGRYSGTPNMEVFLKGHAGDLLKVNRQGRERQYVEHPALTLGLAVQPAVLEDIARVRGFDSRGLLARFLYSLPLSLVGSRRIVPEAIPEHIAQAYERNVIALTLSLTEWTDPAVLPLTDQADAVLIAYQERNEPKLGKGGTHAHIAKWAGKLDGATVRLAGLLHLAGHLTDGWGRPIEAEAMTSAVRLGDYFTAHALATFDSMGADPQLARARSVLEWLRENPCEAISRRDLFAKLSRSEFATVADLEPALELLEEHGYLRTEAPPPRSAGARGRPRSPRYQVNPELRGGQR